MKAKSSLYWHFLNIIIPLIVFVFIALIGIYEWVHFNKDKDELSTKLSHLTSTYSLLLSDAVAAKRIDILQLYSIALISDKDIVFMEIKDASGEVLESYGATEHSERTLLKSVSINHATTSELNKVGELSIGLSSHNMLTDFYNRIHYEVILLITMLGVVLYAVRLAYVETIGNPLELLTRSIKTFKKHRQHNPVEYENDDELGTVIHRFNDMQVHQLMIQQELKNQYFSLEKIVAERTHELEAELVNHAETSSKLYNEKQRAQITLNSINDSVVTTDAEGIIEFMNPAAYKLLNYKKGFANGKDFSDVFHLLSIESRDRVTDLVSWCMEAENHRCPAVEFYLKTDSDKEYIVEAMLTGLLNVKGESTGVVILIRDITLLKKQNNELSYLAQHDMLTGLVNRREFETRLDRLLEDARLNETHHMLFYLDLDNFKSVNDECGHAAGDEVLKKISKEFKKHLRKEDCIGRLGGDEFGVILINCNEEGARQVGEKMRQDIENFKYECNGRSFQLGVSIGIVAITQHATSMEELISQADASCYTAKQNGRNQIHFYTSD